MGHNLGLDHLGGDNLMNAVLTGATMLTGTQVTTILNSPIVRFDGSQRYISVTPIAVLAAAVPEPETWAMMLVGLLGVAGWARRRRACAA